MGSAITKEADEEPPVSGVQVTAGLLRQLEGRPSPDSQAKLVVKGGPSWLPHLGAAGQPSGSDSGNSAANSTSSHSSSPDASHKTQHDNLAPSVHHQAEQPHQQASPRDIKAEDASQQKVNEYADQLVKEYEVPLKAFPCQDEKTECMLCYQSNQQDPLRCAAQVDAFTKCARKASAVMVK